MKDKNVSLHPYIQTPIMKRRKNLLLMLLLLCAGVNAQTFDTYFADQTLRVDYLFTGNASHQAICVDGLSSLPRWAGRRHHLAELPLAGNGQITMRDARDSTVIYRTSFSSLFQEWLSTDEARTTTKGFENSFLLPWPKQPVLVEITLRDPHQAVQATLQHRIDPQDILIQRKGLSHITPHKYLLKSGTADRCIDVAILAEGYTKKKMKTFYRDAQAACESLFGHEPFRSMKERFNVVAVASPSEDSGVSIPRLG